MNCERCKKAVYAAEKLTALGKTFHKTCFKCTACSKALSPGGFVDHENNQYCQSCFDKNFRLKGYGFGGGAALDSFQPTNSAPGAAPAETKKPVNAQPATNTPTPKPAASSPAPKPVAPVVSSSSSASSTSGKTCRSCKKANAAGTRFCGQCGEIL